MMYASKRREIDLFVCGDILEEIIRGSDLILCAGALVGVDDEQIIACAADEGVVTGACNERIVAIAARNGIIARAAVDVIIASIATDDVAAGGDFIAIVWIGVAENHIVIASGTIDDAVGSRRIDMEIVAGELAFGVDG